MAAVRDNLKQTLELGNMPHAWLFSGPRGTGKTSAARILAKAVNCRKGIGEPCNKCEMCESITAGSAVDVMEIDAASNRGIDDIRELREKIKLAPMKAKNKVFIIDEVHMLTAEAANALLKILEEPPANTLFILCTTEPDKLPITVISRCTRVQFGTPSQEDIQNKLVRVAKAEKLNISSENLAKIAWAAHGSFRDGIKILEQIGSGGETDAVLGLVAGKDAEQFWKVINQGDSKAGVDFIEDLVVKGGNVRTFVEQLVDWVREGMYDMVEKGAGREKLLEKIQVIEELDGVYQRMKTAVVTQLPLEMWVIQNSNPNIGEIIQKPEEVKPVAKAGKYVQADVEDKWGEVMKKVKPKNHSIEALLRSTKLMSFDGKSLELEVFYKFHLDKLGSEKCREIVEAAVAEVFKVPKVRLNLRLGKKAAAAKEELSAGVGEDIVKAAAEIFGVDAV